MLLPIIFPDEGSQSEKPARGAASLRPACITKKNDSLPAWAVGFSFSSWVTGQCPAASLPVFSPGKTARRSWSRWRQFAKCRPPPDWWRKACRWCPREAAGPGWLLRLFCEMHRWRVWVRSSRWHPQNKLLKTINYRWESLPRDDLSSDAFCTHKALASWFKSIYLCIVRGNGSSLRVLPKSHWNHLNIV